MTKSKTQSRRPRPTNASGYIKRYLAYVKTEFKGRK